MRLLDGTIVGLCYGFSMGLANLWKVLSAEEGVRYLRPPRRAIPRMLGMSLVYTLATAIGISGLNWIFKGLDTNPKGGVRVGAVELLLIAWGVVVVAGVAASGVHRLSQATGVNLVAQGRLKTAATGAAIGMVLSWAYIFGGHVLRGQ